jgi:hypothetical protein
MPPAQADIVRFVGFDLCALQHGTPGPVDARCHGGRLTAAAHSADLAKLVGDRQQLLAALEQLALEICPEAITDHRKIETVGNTCQLPNLPRCEELRFIDEDAIERLCSIRRFNLLEMVVRPLRSMLPVTNGQRSSGSPA